MNSFVLWGSAYILCGTIAFGILVHSSKGAAQNWADVCARGWWAALLGFTAVALSWLPALLVGLVIGLFKNHEARKIHALHVAQAMEMWTSLQEMDRAMPEAEGLLEEITRLRAELHAEVPPAGEQAERLRARVEDLDRRHVSICSLVSRTMSKVMVGLCMDCGGALREEAPREGVGTSCSACGAFFPYDKLGAIVDELRRRRVGIWGEVK